MAESLLEIVNNRLAVPVDPDSDGGQVLAILKRDPTHSNDTLAGTTVPADITLVPSAGGVRMAAADTGDALLLGAPAVGRPFAIVDREDGGVDVKIALHEPRLRVAGLRAATAGPDGRLVDGGGGHVEALLPSLLLVVSVPPGERFPPARLRSSPEPGAGHSVRFEPPHAFLGPGTAVGLHLPSAVVDFDASGGTLISISEVDIFIAPPGATAFATRGKGRDLSIALAPGGGVSGRTAIVVADDPAQRPRWLKGVGGELWLERSRPVAVALRGTIALTEELSAALGGEVASDGPEAIDYRLALELLDAATWSLSLALVADGGEGVLWRSQRGEPHVRRLVPDTLGAFSVVGPLATPAPAKSGMGFTDLALAVAVVAPMITDNPALMATTQAVTLHGATLGTRDGPGGLETALMVDLEIELSLKVSIGVPLLETRRPIRVRQRSMGLRLDADGLAPVFDPSAGFDLDLSDPGTFEVKEPLRDFLQPDNPSIARDNPLVLAFDLTPKLDLGVVTIERGSVRVPLDGSPPTLSALGVRVEAGLFSGSGRMEVQPSGFTGAVDATFGGAVGLRAGGLLSVGTVRHQGEALTSVRVGFHVTWPLPIPLANSGIGFFGILGLFAARSRRDASGGTALEWLIRANGDPARGEWLPDGNGWAIGLGAVLGTLEGGTILNTSGLLMVELPGPRFVFVMRAKILAARPKVGGRPENASLLAVIEVSRDRISIGLVARYEMPFLIEVVVPAEAAFTANRPTDWRLDIGRFEGPRVSVRFMRTIRADGYLMLRGGSVTIPALGTLPGPATVAGICAALTWGPVEIGLYIRVAARADAGIALDPPCLIGRIALEGELSLFIASIGVAAEAGFLVTAETFWVSLEVKGRIRVLFAKIEGKVRFELGTAGLQPPSPLPAVRALSLQSRTPVLLPGQGAGELIDGTLARAAEGAGDEVPVVPIDAIPVIEFELPPAVELGPGANGGPDEPRARLDGVPIAARAGDWVQRGARRIRCTVTGLDVVAVGRPTPFGEGTAVPSVWYDKNGQAALALLNAIPEATPSAAIRSRHRDEEIARTWGGICRPVAPPTSILWTFGVAPLGPSEEGWTVVGTPFPDPPGTQRFTPPAAELAITEPWRTGDPFAEALVAVAPAEMVASGAAFRTLRAPRTGPAIVPRPLPDGLLDSLGPTLRLPLLKTVPDALGLRFGGASRIRALVFADGEAWRFRLVCRDAGGHAIDEREVAAAGATPSITTVADLPPAWKDPAGPWASLIAPAIGFGGLFLLAADLPEGTDHADLGFEDPGMEEPIPWGLLAIEAWTAAEVRRAAIDTEKRTVAIKTVNGLFAAEDASRKLLHPDTSYVLTVRYVTETDAAKVTTGEAPVRSTPATNASQTFRFRTAKEPPELRPYVLATTPEEGERDVFTDDPVRVVFAHGGVRKLYEAHGREIVALVRAASGRHPPSDGGIGAGAIAGEFVAPVTPAPVDVGIDTPFLLAMQEATSELDCIVRTERKLLDGWPLPMPLEPRMNYVLDLAVRRRDGVPTPKPLYPPLRRTFATSRYASETAFAASIAAAAPRHRHIVDPLPVSTLTGPVVADLEMDRALIDARWGDLAPPPATRLTVLWTGTAAPFTPVGVLVETLEPVFRRRGVPELLTDVEGRKAYRRVARPSLELRDVAAPVATRIVATTGGMRTLFLVPPNARDGTLRLVLRRTFHLLADGRSGVRDAPAGEFVLAAPPWERT